jgi:hypothetical protein
MFFRLSSLIVTATLVGLPADSQELPHGEDMLIAYLPTERILIEADLFDSRRPGDPPATGCRSSQSHALGPFHGSPKRK